MGIDHLRSTDRKFLPAEIYSKDYADFDSTQYDGYTYTGSEDFTSVPCHLRPPCKDCGRLERHKGCIIVAIDGACRGNGTVNARSSIGVYFAKFSQHNVSRLLDNDPTPTNQRAELAACISALRKVSKIKDSMEETLAEVVIKADSEYVVKAMTVWILKWRTNDYRTTKGQTVLNVELFKEIDQKVFKLNDMGIKVLFWHVLRARNKEADELANDAF